jgi:hypothetical protein
MGWASYKSLLRRDNINVDLRESISGNVKCAEPAEAILVMNVKVRRIVCYLHALYRLQSSLRTSAAFSFHSNLFPRLQLPHFDLP